ncbi:hypothetical protein ACFPRL_02225 [Pseudoclavibacter helvolus]
MCARGDREELRERLYESEDHGVKPAHYHCLFERVPVAGAREHSLRARRTLTRIEWQPRRAPRGARDAVAGPRGAAGPPPDQ